MQVVVFEYPDLIGLMWQKTISSQQLSHLEHTIAPFIDLDGRMAATSFMDDSRGNCNLWPVEKLAPCKLSVVYHKTRKDRLVILSRFANFLESVPSYPPQSTHASSSDSQ